MAAAKASLLEVFLRDVQHWPVAQAVVGAFLGAAITDLHGKPLVVAVQAAARGAVQGSWQEERSEALPDLKARLDAIGKEMEARAAMAQVAGVDFTHGAQAYQWARGLDPHLGASYRQAKRQRDKAAHQLKGPSSPCHMNNDGSTVGTTGQTSEFEFSDGKASDATGCSKNLASDVEAPGFSDPVQVKTQALPLDQIPDLGLGASHSGNLVVDVGAPGFIDPAQVKNQDLLSDKVPDSNHGAPQAAILDHVKATSQAVPALTSDVVAEDTVGDGMANSNVPQDLPWPGFEVHAYLASTGRTPEQELVVVDDMIVKTTRELKRLAKRIAQATKQASKLKQPSELVDEYITSWKDERASYLKVLTGLKATRTAVLAVVVPGDPNGGGNDLPG